MSDKITISIETEHAKIARDFLQSSFEMMDSDTSEHTALQKVINQLNLSLVEIEPN